MVVTFNPGPVVVDTVRSVTRLLPEAELVLVDNDSSDQTVAEAREVAPDLRLVAGQGNVGFGVGVNLGVSAARAAVVLVLNPDAPLTGVSASDLTATINSEVPFGLVACAVEDRGERSHLVFRQRKWTFELTVFLAWAFLMPRELRYSRPQVSPADADAWVCGTAFLVSRQEFEEAGGFDRAYFLYCEDSDLSRRYRLRGLPLGVTDSISVAHSPVGEKASRPAARVGWTLLSMVDYAARWEGPRAGRGAAAYVWWFLRVIVATAPFSSRLPGIGGRARKSSRRAVSVRSHIVQFCEGRIGRRDAYPLARQAFARYLDHQSL